MLGNECDFDIQKRDFTAKEANVKWFTDITQTPCKDGKLYIASVMDCFGGEIISLAMDSNLKKKPVRFVILIRISFP